MQGQHGALICLQMPAMTVSWVWHGACLRYAEEGRDSVMGLAHLGRAVLPAGAACTGATAVGTAARAALLDAVPVSSLWSGRLPLLLPRAAHPITQQRLGRVRPAILQKGQAQVRSPTVQPAVARHGAVCHTASGTG